MAGAGLWLVAVLLHPLSVLAPVGILLLIVAGIAYLIRPRNRTMYWRDRQIELTDDSPTFAHQLYRAVFKH
ncbi:MAG TPA: hypothetical protein VGQ62_24420 [Chloroflexota bacterium]|nr:hypothetical protein [Chloroflexota bacterium]